MTECSICVEKFNISTRKKIVCTKCNIEVCASCIKRYILELNDSPQCMNCKCGFSSDFISSNMTQKFYNQDLRNATAKLLLNKEKSKFM